LGGELLQAPGQFLPPQLPVFGHDGLFDFRQGRQGHGRLYFFFHGSSFISLSAG
jgi:hypothetical protein